MHLKIFVVLGMFLFVDLLKQLSKADQEAVIEKMANVTVIERIMTAMRMIYKINIKRIKDRLVFSKDNIKCEKCGSMIAKLDVKVYPRLSIEFLRDLGITILASVFPEKIFIQRFGCPNRHCKITTDSLKRKNLPYSIYSFGVMDFILTTYLGSGASLRVVSELCKRNDRPVSPVFIWKQIQKVGNLFSRQIKLLRHLFSGHHGVDECYPPTIEGKSGILAAIDQVYGFIVCIRQGTTFKRRT